LIESNGQYQDLCDHEHPADRPSQINEEQNIHMKIMHGLVVTIVGDNCLCVLVLIWVLLVLSRVVVLAVVLAVVAVTLVVMVVVVVVVVVIVVVVMLAVTCW
jgi:ABC-type nickel/cobalt efflux system permease component RcnA